MADIGEKLQALLSSPDGMEKLQSAASQLQGILGDSDVAGDLLTKLAGDPQISAPAPAPPPKTGGMDLTLLTKAAPLLQAMQAEDDSTKLLEALRPYLHNERQKRLDEAMEIMKWLRLATLLKQQGIL